MLDSLEYGFDVEVVGAVGVNVLESGGAYVGQVLVFDGVAFVLVGGDGEPAHRRCHHELVFDIGPPLWEPDKDRSRTSEAPTGAAPSWTVRWQLGAVRRNRREVPQQGTKGLAVSTEVAANCLQPIGMKVPRLTGKAG